MDISEQRLHIVSIPLFAQPEMDRCHQTAYKVRKYNDEIYVQHNSRAGFLATASVKKGAGELLTTRTRCLPPTLKGGMSDRAALAATMLAFKQVFAEAEDLGTNLDFNLTVFVKAQRDFDCMTKFTCMWREKNSPTERVSRIRRGT